MKKRLIVTAIWASLPYVAWVYVTLEPFDMFETPYNRFMFGVFTGLLTGAAWFFPSWDWYK